jgi:16S rRNA (adenine1518-N6/adenine1519-N6)-dimethyltransferase
LVSVIDTAPGDVFLEIGPGRGALTQALAPRVERIIGIEIDRDLAAALRDALPINVQIVQGDFLRADLGPILADLPGPIRVVGNLPYNVASPILFRLLRHAEYGDCFRDATLMLQKEVADRLCASVGEEGYGALAIQVGLLANVEQLLTLPPGAFRPAPKVTSAVVRVTFRRPAAEVTDVEAFGRLVRGLFLQRRKTLVNALRPITDPLGLSSRQVIEQAGLDPSRRPETLTLDEMARLARAVL